VATSKLVVEKANGGVSHMHGKPCHHVTLACYDKDVYKTIRYHCVHILINDFVDM
jgi:hypothetical protein